MEVMMGVILLVILVMAYINFKSVIDDTVEKITDESVITLTEHKLKVNKQNKTLMEKIKEQKAKNEWITSNQLLDELDKE